MIPLVAQSRYGMANSIMSTTKRMVTTFSALFVCSFKLSEKSALGYRFGAGFLWRYVVKQGMCREQKAISGWVWCNDQACLYAKTRQQCWLVAYFLLTLRCEVRLRLSLAVCKQVCLLARLSVCTDIALRSQAAPQQMPGSDHRQAVAADVLCLQSRPEQKLL